MGSRRPRDNRAGLAGHRTCAAMPAGPESSRAGASGRTPTAGHSPGKSVRQARRARGTSGSRPTSKPPSRHPPFDHPRETARAPCMRVLERASLRAEPRVNLSALLTMGAQLARAERLHSQSPVWCGASVQRPGLAGAGRRMMCTQRERSGCGPTSPTCTPFASAKKSSAT